MKASLFTKLFMADKWNIGCVHQTKESFIEKRGLMSEVRWLKEDTIDYAADPFIEEIDGSVYVFYEELSFWKGRGELKFIRDFDFKTKRRISGDLPSNIHLSYPFLFKDKAQLYCLPETSGLMEVGLYKLDPGDLKSVKKVRVLVSGKPYVDSSMIYYNGQFWLFTSVSQIPDQIYIYYAATLQSDFVPHRSNPIKVDSFASRGAGDLFVVNGVLYRPTQNPNNCYGGSVVISRIVELSEQAFVYEVDFQVSPKAPYRQGLHNVSFAGNWIVLDGKRRVTSFYMPVKKLVRKLRSHL